MQIHLGPLRPELSMFEIAIRHQHLKIIMGVLRCRWCVPKRNPTPPETCCRRRRFPPRPMGRPGMTVEGIDDIVPARLLAPKSHRRYGAKPPLCPRRALLRLPPAQPHRSCCRQWPVARPARRNRRRQNCPSAPASRTLEAGTAAGRLLGSLAASLPRCARPLRWIEVAHALRNRSHI